MPDISEISLVDILPASIASDPDVLAAAQAIDTELASVTALCRVPSLFARIDQLDSTTLDHLAWQFDSKIWRDSWPLNLKRSVIKTVILEKSKKGTRAALQNAVQSLGSAVAITEWWETSPLGTPYTFDITVTLSDLEGAPTAQVQADLLRSIDDVKPVRSHYNFALAAQAAAGLYIGGAARPVIYSRLNTVANY